MSKPVLQVLQRTVRQPPPPAMLVRRPGQLHLRITGGPASPRAETFTKDRITCGRSVVNDIVLDDPLLSGTHFSLELAQDGVRVVDRGSTNGTWFCGGRVSELSLSAGMSVTAGAYRFEILGTDSIEVPVLMASEFHGMHGESTAMREIFARLSRLADTDLDLFVEGETDTGKEMVARALHAASPRSHLPFAVLDCAMLTRNLAEEEIFGHAKGAYTQVHEAAPGCFEEANGGTLFIDEIGELPLDLQPRLLRVLDRGEVQWLGERKPRKVDVRVVAATNRDLRQMVADGQFREDLYFRLIEDSIRLPPLREREGDARYLAEVMLAKLSQEVGLALSLTREAREAVKRHAWPGNVRELYKVLAPGVSVGAVAGDRAERSPAQIRGGVRAEDGVLRAAVLRGGTGVRDGVLQAVGGGLGRERQRGGAALWVQPQGVARAAEAARGVRGAGRGKWSGMIGDQGNRRLCLMGSLAFLSPALVMAKRAGLDRRPLTPSILLSHCYGGASRSVDDTKAKPRRSRTIGNARSRSSVASGA